MSLDFALTHLNVSPSRWGRGAEVPGAEGGGWVLPQNGQRVHGQVEDLRSDGPVPQKADGMGDTGNQGTLTYCLDCP